ncbi:hypothetical protein NO559_07245 [Dasania sp. GY-MA-18]|uniref:Uncharacterized protein n=1 Tax=Dasania phycosphaerae TaxID=2950436 RepID=A0A9J6RLC9_9GAMM|nr:MULTISPECIES: hypothetical protein [Dasania]MCR8922562.1 hypothetical protein [Dasania sp. GY-MA-18]MCZ0864991.1 hypothetical protein [Dasania phycosphaerae]MCZ0868718.1 hypothetical protein [Dasania phycosphaerae]
MKYLPTAAIASLLISTSTAAIAGNEIFQECLLEGKVVADKAEDGKNIVRIDFYKAQPYKPESRCIIDGTLEFKQPKGSIIENLSEGSVVQYHYIKTTNGQTNWQLIGAFI